MRGLDEGLGRVEGGDVLISTLIASFIPSIRKRTWKRKRTHARTSCSGICRGSKYHDSRLLRSLTRSSGDSSGGSLQEKERDLSDRVHPISRPISKRTFARRCFLPASKSPDTWL